MSLAAEQDVRAEQTEAEYQVVQYTPDLRAAVLDLSRHIWGPDLVRNAAYLDWKYIENPNLRHDSPLIFLALHGEAVVGMRGVHALRVEAEGEEGLTLACFGDSVIDPQHRKRGLLSLVSDRGVTAAKDLGYPYLLGISNVPSTYFHLLKNGWTQAVSYDLLHRYAGRRRLIVQCYRLARPVPVVTKLAGALRRSIRRPKPAASAEDPDPFAILDRNAASDRGRISLEQAARPAAMADLVRRLGSDGRLRQVRDVDYLAWRYRNPLARYRFLYCGGDRLDGYLVVQARRFGSFGVVNLVDWEASSQEIRASLLRSLLKWGQFELLRIWAANLPVETHSLLKSERFGPYHAHHSGNPYRPGLLVRALQEGRQDWSVGRRQVLNADDWDLRMIYSDGF